MMDKWLFLREIVMEILITTEQFQSKNLIPLPILQLYVTNKIEILLLLEQIQEKSFLWI